MSDWQKTVEKAREQLQQTAFEVVSDRELDNQASFRILERIGPQEDGRSRYRVVEEKPQDNWY